MENLSAIVILTYWIFYTIALLVLYHKVFTVYYFSVSKGLLKELKTSAIIGFILAAISTYYWIVGVIVIVILAGMCMSKIQNPEAKKSLLLLR